MSYQYASVSYFLSDLNCRFVKTFFLMPPDIDHWRYHLQSCYYLSLQARFSFPYFYHRVPSIDSLSAFPIEVARYRNLDGFFRRRSRLGS